MAIVVESKLHTTRPLESDAPQYFRLILLIECVTSVNEDESPVLLLGVMRPQETHRVNAPLYSRLHHSAQLICPTGLLYLLSRYLDH